MISFNITLCLCLEKNAIELLKYDNLKNSFSFFTKKKKEANNFDPFGSESIIS